MRVLFTGGRQLATSILLNSDIETASGPLPAGADDYSTTISLLLRRDLRPVAVTGIRREALHGLHAGVQRVYRILRRHRLQAAALVHLRGHAGVGGAQ